MSPPHLSPHPDPKSLPWPGQPRRLLQPPPCGWRTLRSPGSVIYPLTPGHVSSSPTDSIIHRVQFSALELNSFPSWQLPSPPLQVWGGAKDAGGLRVVLIRVLILAAALWWQAEHPSVPGGAGGVGPGVRTRVCPELLSRVEEAQGRGRLWCLEVYSECQAGLGGCSF